MCGRFTLTASGEELADLLELDEVPTVAARYNIAPTQPVLAVRSGGRGLGRAATLLTWGLRSEPASGLLLNARSETAHRLPAFREAFQRRRCLVPASGFFEWLQGPRQSVPYYFALEGGRPFALAGLWEPAADGPGSVVLLTTAPTETVARVHDRMPLILPRDSHEEWLESSGLDQVARARLLVPFQAGTLAFHPVSPAVNDVGHDAPDCVAPVRDLFS